MLLFVMLSLVLAATGLLYWLLLLPHPEIRHIPPVPLFWYLFYFLTGSTREQIHRKLIRPTIEKHGPVFRLWRFGRWMVLSASPEDARKILLDPGMFQKHENHLDERLLVARFVGHNLLFKNGQQWRRDRQIVNPAFNRSWPTKLFESVALSAVSAIEREGDGRPIDVLQLMSRVTLDALGKAVFDFDFNAVKDPAANKYLQAYTRIFDAIKSPLRFLFPSIELLGLIPNAERFRDVEEFDKLIYGLMNRRLKEALERKVQGKVLDDDERARADLLTLMAEAAVNPTEMHRTETGINTITEKDLRANVVLFYVAGHDTTASSLSYTLLELARQPDFQSKARDEIFRVLDKDGHGETIIPTEEQQKTFTYLNAIIYETQRKYPVVTVLARKPQGPVQLGKYHIAHNPKNSVGIYVYGLHHDPDIYPDPDEFIPERFDTKSDSDSGHHRRRVPFSWIPFSEGQRMCLGKRFSLVEQRVILAVLLQRFRLQLPANSPYWNDSFTKNSFVATPTGLRIEFVPLGH